MHTDAKGRKWLGEVPYDVFFDDPIAVAAEGRGQPASVAHEAVKPHTNAVASTAKAAGAPSMASKEASDSASADDWNRLIDADVLDAELKRIRNELTAQLQSVAKYNSHYQDISISAATLAAVAEIAAEHSGSLRWKTNAPVVRDLGLRIHDAASATGAQAFQAAKTPYEQLIDVLDGNVPAGLPPAERRRDFSQVASRNGVMKRMDRSFQWLKKNASAKQLPRKDAEQTVREAELLAALSRVIAVGHYDSADDPKYKGYAAELSKSARDVAAAAKSGDGTAFSDAITRVQKRCDACHADFRFE